MSGNAVETDREVKTVEVPLTLEFQVKDGWHEAQMNISKATTTNS